MSQLTRSRASAPDLTGAALRFVSERQNARRQGKRSDLAYLVYVAVLILGAYVSPYAVALTRLSTPNRGSDVAAAVSAGLPTAVPTLFLAVYLLACRDALWRGPVSPSAPLSEWLLPTPLSRRRLLTGRYLNALAVNAISVLAVGLVLAVGSYACGIGSLPGLLIAGGVGGAVTGAAATGLAFVVQRWGRRTTGPGTATLVTVGTIAAVLLLVAGCAVTAESAVDRAPVAGTGVLAWIGPWGWAAQFVTHEAGIRSGGWQPALVGAVLCALAAIGACRYVDGLDANELRRRARSFAQVASSVATMDFRQARLSSQIESGVRRRRVRLPMPRSRQLVIAWRDANFVLRFPWKVANAGLALAIASGLLWWAADDRGAAHSAQPALVLGAGIAYYVGATQLVETARLEADDPGRSEPLGPGFGEIALAHAVVPLVVLLTMSLVAAGILTATTHAGAAVLVLPAAAPEAVAAALISAYRGPLPVGLFAGTQTPLGNTAPIQIGIWYLRGALAMLITLTPAMLVLLRSRATPSDLFTAYLFLLVVGELGLLWARRLAQKLRERV
jgi:hypothetical protein